MATRVATDCRSSDLRTRTRRELAAIVRVGDLALRLPRHLTDPESERVRAAGHVCLGRLYDTGFNIDSRRQFCSRVSCEALSETCWSRRAPANLFLDPALQVAFDGRLCRGADARPRTAWRAPVPLQAAHNCLSLPVGQGTSTYRGDTEWRNS